MENNINANRGTRKKVALLVKGDQRTIIHPYFLHVSKSGYLRGFLVTENRDTHRFTLSLADLQKEGLCVVKGYV